MFAKLYEFAIKTEYLAKNDQTSWRHMIYYGPQRQHCEVLEKITVIVRWLYEVQPGMQHHRGWTGGSLGNTSHLLL